MFETVQQLLRSRMARRHARGGLRRSDLDLARAPRRGGGRGVGVDRPCRHRSSAACRRAAGQLAGHAALDGGGRVGRLRAVRDQHHPARRRAAGRHPARGLPTAACRFRPPAAAGRAGPWRRHRARRGRRSVTSTRSRPRRHWCRTAKSAPTDTLMMIFTSGTSGDPKAVRFAHVMAIMCGASLIGQFDITADDVCYLAMPLFHSNGVAAGWAVAIGSGATMVPATVLAVAIPGRHPPPRRDVHELCRQAAGPAAGHPGAARRCRQHAAGRRSATRRPIAISRNSPERFGCRVVDSFGSSEFAVIVTREDGTPPGSIGKGLSRCRVYHPETVTECAPAIFDEHGALANFDEAVGELVNTQGAGPFAGYYNDPDGHRRADAPRHVLVGRSGLPRRRRLDLPGRSHRGLDAGGRREPGGGTHRANPAAAGPDQPGGGVCGSRRAGRRPGDGRPRSQRRRSP